MFVPISDYSTKTGAAEKVGEGKSEKFTEIYVRSRVFPSYIFGETLHTRQLSALVGGKRSRASSISRTTAALIFKHLVQRLSGRQLIKFHCTTILQLLQPLIKGAGKRTACYLHCRSDMAGTNFKETQSDSQRQHDATNRGHCSSYAFARVHSEKWAWSEEFLCTDPASLAVQDLNLWEFVTESEAKQIVAVSKTSRRPKKIAVATND